MSNQQLHGVQGGATEGAREARGAGSWMDHAAAARAWEREHEAEWVRVDRRLRGIAARRAALDAEEAGLLRYAEELKLWRGWGFGSMVEYMERAMGYTPHTAAERLRVARAVAELPLIADALEQGALAHSAVRELSRVAVPETEEDWLEAARGKSLREIEAMVSGRKPGDLPTDPTEPRLHRKKITIEISPEGYDLWRRMHALAAEEHGQRLSDEELITSLFRRAYGADGAGGSGGKTGSPGYKIAIKQCPDCKRARQFSGGRDIEVDPVVAECASCDALDLGSLDAAAPERATMTVTPRRREQVLARDGYCCTVPGCRRNIGLDLHHIEYQSCGGGHEIWNMATLCDLHHRAVHGGKLVIRGTAPDRVTYEFRKPRDRWNVTVDDEVRVTGGVAGSARPPSGARAAGLEGRAAPSHGGDEARPAEGAVGEQDRRGGTLPPAGIPLACEPEGPPADPTWKPEMGMRGAPSPRMAIAALSDHGVSDRSAGDGSHVEAGGIASHGSGRIDA